MRSTGRSWLALVALSALAGCGGGGGASDGACLLPAADPGATVPAGLPALDGSVLYAPTTQGKTAVVFAHVPQGDFVKVRDELADRIRAAGWTIEGTDQEAVEAEAQFSRRSPLLEGSIKVEPLEGCDGFVSVRYRLSS